MRTRNNKFICLNKHFLVFLSIFLLLFQDLVYADPEIVNKDKNQQQEVNASNSKTKQLKDPAPYTSENNPLKTSLGSASVSPNDLSGIYNIVALATNLYPDIVNAQKIFKLVLTYSTNIGSDYWGHAFGLDLPVLSFKQWVKICQGNCDEHSAYDPTKPFQSKISSKFPENIDFSSGGTHVSFKIAGSKREVNTRANTVTYVPAITSGSNYLYRIKASLASDNHTYTFEVDQLNNKNNYTIFTFDGSSNKDEKGLLNASKGELVALKSSTYNNSTLPINVDYQNPNDITAGVVVYGAKKNGPHSIWLDGSYPNHDMFNQVIPKDPDSSTPLGCYVYDGYHEFMVDGHIISTDPGFENPWYDYYASLPAKGPWKGSYYENCPEEPFDITQYDYSKFPVTYSEQEKGERNMTIRGVNLNNKPVTIDLNISDYDETISNLLAEGGLATQHHDNGMISMGPTSTVTNYLYYVTLANTTSTIKNAISRLNYINWTVDGVSVQNVKFTYDGFVTPVNNISRIGLHYYGLTSANSRVPLLKAVSGTSQLAPITNVTFDYDTAPYKNFYTIQSMTSLGNDIPMTEVLNNKYAAIIDQTSIAKEESSSFTYVKKLTVSGTNTQSISTNYSWGDDGYNIHYMYNQPLKITTTESSVAETDNMIRSASNFYAITHGVQRATDDKWITPEDLKGIHYSTVTDNGVAVAIATYNRYGLVEKGMTCPEDYNKDISKCKLTQINYGGVVGAQLDLEAESSIPFEIVNSAQSFSENGNLISTIKPTYDVSGKPIMVETAQGNGELVSVSKFTYKDLGDDYFTISQTEQYSRPFIKDASDSVPSRIYTIANYNYKDMTIGDHTYSTLESEGGNMSGLRYGTTLYKYDPQNLRLMQTVSCVSPSGSKEPPQCALDKKSDRYTAIQNMAYDDNNQSITMTSSEPGSYQQVWYKSGTGLVESSISADGTKQVNTYDDYGRIINSKTSILSKSDPTKEVIMSNNSIAYMLDKSSNSLTVTHTDIFDNKSMQHYNALEQKDCEIASNVSTTLDGHTSVYTNSKNLYTYDLLGQVQIESSFLGNATDSFSCDKGKEGNLISTSRYEYDYTGRVIDNKTDMPEYTLKGESQITRKEYQTHITYSYQDAQPNTSGLWHKILVFLKLNSNLLFNTTTVKQEVKYGSDDWQAPVINTAKTDIFNSTTITTMQLPTTDPIIIESSTLHYNANSNDSPIVATTQAFGSPDSVAKYDELARSVLQVVNPNGSQAESMSYVYDDLDRVQQVLANGKIKPYATYYDDNGYASQSVYSYTDNGSKHRLTDTVYENNCLFYPALIVRQIVNLRLRLDS